MYEVLINKIEEKRQIILLEDKNIVEKYEENSENEITEGNIYIGKVRNVLPGMQAAFVDIGKNKNTFIHLKDILPKVDVKNENTQDISKKNIKQFIKPGMDLMVQVKKDSTNKKGARVSTHISLTGKYIVFMPDTDIITASLKIESEAEKQRLIDIVKKLLPKNCGAIIRTSGENKSEEVLKKDINMLLSDWDKIKKARENFKEYPVLIYKNNGMLKRLFVDMIEKDISKIVLNDKNEKNTVENILKEIDKTNINIELKENVDLIEEYFLKQQLEKIQNRKVWLKCGGFITIDKAEALTAIDVNSGKYVGTKDLEQTVFTVNKEATKEIAKQLRLRDIGGIIIIDYIDMKDPEHKEKIEKLLAEELKNDRSKTQVIGFTKLNLMEMTRKHIGIYE